MSAAGKPCQHRLLRCIGESDAGAAWLRDLVQPHDTMQPLPTPPLCILPGRLIVTFLVNLGCVGAVLVMVPGRFLEGLRAARDLLGFAELWRDDEALDELLPWAGNV